jgi:hypothetical protein
MSTQQLAVTVFKYNSASTTGGISVFESKSASFNNASELDSIQKLLKQNVILDINQYISKFTSGKFDELSYELTDELYASLSVKLFNLQNSKLSSYEKVRVKYGNSLELLMQSIKQYLEYKIIDRNLASANEKVSILEDLEKLADYLEDLKTQAQSKIFPDVEVQAPLMTLKPEYDIYIRTIGFPPGGIFDADLLAQIKSTLE